MAIEVELGAPFPGSELHHLTPSVGVYMPAALHRSVAHCLATGEGKAEVNALALAFYGSAPRTPLGREGATTGPAKLVMAPAALMEPGSGFQRII